MPFHPYPLTLPTPPPSVLTAALRNREPHSFAFSSKTPIFNLSAYFFNTCSLWYYNRQTVSLAARHTNLASGLSNEPEVSTTSQHPHLPKLLAGVLSRSALEDLGTTGVFLKEP
jgi:hypothetical protein